MNNEEKFKQSLKSLVESKEFDFDEKDWDKAAAYIDKKRAGNRATRTALLALIVAGIIGTTALFIPSSDSSSKQTAQTINPGSPENITNTLSTQTKSSDVITAQTLTEEQKSTGLEKTGSSAIPETPTAPGNSSPNNRPAGNETTDEKVTQTGKMDVSFSRKKKVEQKNVQPVPDVVTPVVTAKTGTVETKHPETKALPVTNTPPLKEVPADKNPEETVASIQETVAPVPAETQSQTAVVVAEKKDVPDSIKAKIPRTMLLSLEAGPSYMFGWKNEGADRDANGFNPVVGIHYMSPIDSRFTLSFGLQYQRTGHLSAYSNTSKQSRYSFGEESEVMTITPSKLHYIALPVRLYYKLDEKNTVGGSYSISYLLDVESNVESYTLKVGKQSNNKNYTTRGYTDGFSMFDSQLSLFYRRHLIGAFSAHAEVFAGLNDVKQNNFFGGSKSQRNSGIRLMIVYGIYNRNK